MAGHTLLNKSRVASSKTQFQLHELGSQRLGEVATEGREEGGRGRGGKASHFPDIQS